ncbi:MAG: T9SS type A sorting domain-containing protein [Flavobacteriaceae bacterium]
MKNLLLPSAMLLLALPMFSQLYVTPNTTTSTDSYVYVNDQVLFVEQDVNMVQNTYNAATTASLYLRNGAQLIQGTTGSANNGTGLLSVYQTIDTTSAFHYTFWNPPVGLPSGGAGNTNAGISRYYDCDTCGDQTTSATLVSTTPGYNGNSITNPMTVSTRWIYKKLSSPDNDAEANWVRINGTDAVPAGYGMIMKGVSDPGSLGTYVLNVDFDLRGRPNNGTISVPVNTGSVQRVLVGNPYPSAIDLKTFWTDNPNVTEIRFWDEPKDSEFSHYYVDKSGGWGTWVPGSAGDTQGIYSPPTFANYDASGIGGAAGTGAGADYPRRYSPIAQGFEVRTDGSLASVQFNNGQRVYVKQDGVNSTFRGLMDENVETEANNPSGSSDPSGSGNPPPYEIASQLMRINFVMDETYTRQLILGFSEDATDGFDRGYDARSPMDAKGAEAFFPIRNLENDLTQPYVINFVRFQMGKKIPLSFTLNHQTSILVKVKETYNFPAGIKAYLRDDLNNTTQQISDGSEVNLLLNTGDYDDRFYIIFIKPGDDSDIKSSKEVITNVDFFQNNPARQLEVSNPEGYDVKLVNIFDMSGKLVYSEKNAGNSTRLTFPTNNFSDGVYLVKLTTNDNVVIDYKMNVFNK